MLLATRLARLARLLADPELRRSSLADWLKALSIIGMSTGIGAAVVPGLVADLAADALATFGVRLPAYFQAVPGDGPLGRIAFGAVIALAVTALLVTVVYGAVSLIRAALGRGPSGITVAFALIGLAVGVMALSVPSAFREFLGIVLDPFDAVGPGGLPDALEGGGWTALMAAAAVGLATALLLGTIRSAARLLLLRADGGLNLAPPVILAVSVATAALAFNDPWSALGVVGAIGLLIPFASPAEWFLMEGGSAIYIAPHASGTLALLAFVVTALVLGVAWHVVRRTLRRRAAAPAPGAKVVRWGRSRDARSASRRLMPDP